MLYESLESLSIPGGGMSEVYKESMREALADFWTTRMNPEQVRRGRRSTQVPELIFLTWEQIHAFGDVEAEGTLPKRYIMSFWSRRETVYLG